MSYKKALLIVAQQDFSDEELLQTKQALEAGKIQVEIASCEGGEVKSLNGKTQIADKGLFDVDVADYDAVVFIGGEGAKMYFDDPIAQAIAEEVIAQDKVLAAICIAPSILANAGVLRGKKVTSYPTEEVNLTEKGALYIAQPVAVDGKIITASGPEFAKDFAWKIIEKLGALSKL